MSLLVLFVPELDTLCNTDVSGETVRDEELFCNIINGGVDDEHLYVDRQGQYKTSTWLLLFL